MAQLGHAVHLIERQAFPRRHLGESLSPGVMALLEAADMHETVEAAGFPRVRGVWVDWADGPKLREDPGEKGLLVDRGEFDLRLLERARALGVRVHQPARVRECLQDGAKWRLAIECDGRSSTLDIDFLASATGRQVASGRRRAKAGASTLAVYGYWRGAGLPTVPRIEAGEDAWYWGVPLPDGTTNMLVFTDPESFRPAGGADITKRYLRAIDRSNLMRGCGDAQLLGPARAIDATPYLDEDCVAPNRIHLGDAALVIDPISSSGVQKAIQGSLCGAIVANTLLRRPESADEAVSFYRARLAETSARHRDWAAENYREAARGRDHGFWRRRSATAAARGPAPSVAFDPRASATTPVELSRELEFIRTPCLRGDFVSLASALRHPGLANPLVFLAGHELAPLLLRLPSRTTPLQIAQCWSDRMPVDQGLAIAGWLVRQGVLLEKPYPGGASS